MLFGDRNVLGQNRDEKCSRKTRAEISSVRGVRQVSRGNFRPPAHALQARRSSVFLDRTSTVETWCDI